MQDLNSLPVKGELLRSQSVNVLLEMETTHLLAIFWLWTKSLPFVHSRGQITCEGGKTKGTKGYPPPIIGYEEGALRDAQTCRTRTRNAE